MNGYYMKWEEDGFLGCRKLQADNMEDAEKEVISVLLDGKTIDEFIKMNSHEDLLTAIDHLPEWCGSIEVTNVYELNMADLRTELLLKGEKHFNNEIEKIELGLLEELEKKYRPKKECCCS